MAALLVRMVLNNKSQFLSLARNVRLLSTTTYLRSSSVPSPNLASEQKYSAPTATTGWDKARFPQEELIEMHRRSARTEDPRIERRRRLYMVKLIVFIGASFVTILGSAAALLMFFRHDQTWHGFI